MPDDDETLELLELLNLPPGAPLVQRHRRWAWAFDASKSSDALAQALDEVMREFNLR